MPAFLTLVRKTETSELLQLSTSTLTPNSLPTPPAFKHVVHPSKPILHVLGHRNRSLPQYTCIIKLEHSLNLETPWHSEQTLPLTEKNTD